MATAKVIRREFVQARINDINVAKRNLAFVRKHGSRAAKIVAKLQKAGFDAYAFPVGHTHFTIAITFKELDGFTGGDLLKRLAKAEQVAGVEFTGSKDFPENSLREFKGASDDGLLKAEAYAYLKDNATHCKRVQIGTEHVEVPKYQLVCE